MPLFRLPSYAKDNEELTKTIRQQAVEQILDQLAVANEHLESHIYFGEAISVADTYLYIMLNWCRAVGIDFNHLTQLSPFMQRVEADQAVENVREIEGLKG